MRQIRWVAFAAIAVILVGWGSLWLKKGGISQFTKDSVGVAVPGGVSVGGPFSLVDGKGEKITDASFRGRFMLVYFGYTFCPDVCPTELQTVANAMDLLGKDADKVVPIFITVDPARDTPKVVGEYVKLFSPRLVGLTGTPEQIAAVAKAYRVYYAKASSSDATSYLMDHSSFIYLMDKTGKFSALFSQGTSPKDLADGIRSRLAAAS